VEERKRAGIHWAWVILATCFANLFINYSVRLGYGVALPEMLRDLGLGRTAGGSIYNAYLLSYIALTPFTGYMTDRLGARRVIATCSLVLGTGICLMGSSHSLWMACLSFGIAGLGATGMWTPVITVVQRWFAPHRRGLALGILSTGYGLGFATMGAVFPWVVHHFNWRYAWYFLGASALGMVLINGLLLRRDPESTGRTPWGDRVSRPQDGGPEIGPLGRTGTVHVFGERTFWLIGLSYFSIAFSLYGITTFMVDYANVQLGLPMAKASLLATVHGLCQIVGVLAILPLSDLLGRKRTLLISNACITASLVGILLSGDSWQVLYLMVGVLAVFYGATFPMYGACAGDYFPKEVMGTVIGAWTPFYGVGAVLVHWVCGVLRDVSGTYDLAFLINVFMAALAVCLMGAVRGRTIPTVWR
jgi:sugar phosphate permease